MVHTGTLLAIVYVVAATIYIAYVPKEDRAFFAGVLAFLVPLVALAIAIDKFWR